MNAAIVDEVDARDLVACKLEDGVDAGVVAAVVGQAQRLVGLSMGGG